MKRYEELKPEQQEKAVEKCLIGWLEAITEGIRFDDKLNGDDTQARIDRAGEKADRNMTPWFWHEFIMEDEVLADRLRSMARSEAKSALYSGEHENVLPEPATV